MEQIVTIVKNGIHPASLESALYMPEFANKMLSISGGSVNKSIVKQYQYLKWTESKKLLELLADYKLSLRLIKFDIEHDSGGYPIIENGDVKPDFDTEAFLDILDEIAELNEDLRKIRNGNAVFFKEKKKKLTKSLLAMLDVYCLPLQLVSRDSASR